MNEKILITGGAGFIGLHLARRLLDEGYQVDLLDNFARAVDDKELKDILAQDKINFYNIDLLATDQINRLATDYDVIFHLAAIIGVAHVMDYPYDVLYKNINMLGNMIDFARKQDKLSRFLFASTSEVYAGTLKHFDLPIPTPEATPLAVTNLSYPRTSYMLSKIYGEALCQQSGLPFTVFRPHNIYGPRMGMAHVIPEQLRNAHEAEEGDCIDVFSINHTRCFCYIDDAVEMLLRIMVQDDCEGKTLNLGTQNPELKIKEVVQQCFSVVGKELFIDEKPETPGSPSRRVPDMTKTSSLLGYESQVSIHSGVVKTYEWYRKNVFDQDLENAF
jgi:UDP-glucose 4-epimerase